MTTVRETPPLTIISASRRTDIPAFYMPWFMNRLRAGLVAYPNPFGGQVHTVSLRPEHVHSLVFWSKTYRPVLPRGPRSLEPHVPDWKAAVEVFLKLAARTSPAHVQWRFDPILFTDELGAAFYQERFR